LESVFASLVVASSYDIWTFQTNPIEPCFWVLFTGLTVSKTFKCFAVLGAAVDQNIAGSGFLTARTNSAFMI
jgi:hypothetical protein